MSSKKLTIAVVPRERFSYTQTSLESLYANTHTPFDLVYVDGNSPRSIQQYLERQAESRGFRLIRENQFLSPNQARNIAIKHVETEFVIFIDNDVIVRPGWESHLLQCADETQATLIGPMCCEGTNYERLHILGGFTEFKETQGRRWLIERRPFMKLPLADLDGKLKREKVSLIEFHCVMARTEIFSQIGWLDENLWSMAEETDFSLKVLEAGGTIYVEPAAQVSYIVSLPIEWRDLPFFFIRWSDAWCQASVAHMQQKWGLSPDAPVLKKYQEFVTSHAELAFRLPSVEHRPPLLVRGFKKGLRLLALDPAKRLLQGIGNGQATQLIQDYKKAGSTPTLEPMNIKPAPALNL